MSIAFLREKYRRNDGTYLTDISGWKKQPGSSVYYIDKDGNQFRTLPASFNILQNKIEKERKKAEEKVAKARTKLEAADKAYKKITPYTSKFLPAKDRVTKAEKELKKAEEELQIFLIPVAPEVEVNYPIVPFVDYPKRLKKAATSRLRKKKEDASISQFLEAQKNINMRYDDADMWRLRNARAKAKRKAKQEADVNYPIVPFVNYPKRLKKAATRTRTQLPKTDDIYYIGKTGRPQKGPPKPAKPAKTKAQKALEARERREKKKDAAIIAANDAVNAEFGRRTLTPARFRVEVSHKLHPKSKTTNIGRDYWRDMGYSGCISSVNDGKYMYLCDKLQKPQPRKRKKAAAGLSGAGTHLVNLPEYRRAINSLRN